MLSIERAPDTADTVSRDTLERFDPTLFEKAGGEVPSVHLNLRRSTRATEYEGGLIRGGWLTDEVGMGKTVVCIALILAKPADPQQMTTAEDAEKFAAIHAEREAHPTVTHIAAYPATMVDEPTKDEFIADPAVVEWRAELRRYDAAARR